MNNLSVRQAGATTPSFYYSDTAAAIILSICKLCHMKYKFTCDKLFNEFLAPSHVVNV